MLNKIVLDIQALNLASISPMLLLIVFALAILCMGMINKNLSNRVYLSLTTMALLLDLILVTAPLGNFRGMFNLVLMDGIAAFAIFIIIIASIFFIVLRFDDIDEDECNKPEFYTIFLFMVAGFEFMVASDNLILIIVSLELSSLALYALIALKNTKFSIEAALKYFIMGAIGTAFFVFGSALLYFITGSVEIHTIDSLILNSNFQHNLALYAGTIFLIVAIGFKVSLIPFHTWLPDVYEGSSTPLAAYISIVPKIAGFIVALRVFNSLIIADVHFVETILFIIAILTMTLANIVALVQTNIKRMLAFSSISNAGFILAAIFIATTQATISIFLYWSMFTIANLGAFTIIWVIQNSKTKSKREYICFDDFSGLIKSSPLIALIMAIFMLSLAAIPPFSLFWGKIYLIGSAINAKHYILAVIMALNSAIAVYYYLKLIVYMFLKEPTKLKIANLKIINYILIITAALSILSPFVVEYIFSNLGISFMISMSGY